ncbi:MAG: hypothetical protein AMXMBFR84_40350 [Candidatus Hydrogenedentota bacterium]
MRMGAKAASAVLIPWVCLVGSSIAHAQTDAEIYEEIKVIALHNRASYDRIRSFSATGTRVYEQYIDPAPLPFNSPVPPGNLVSTCECSWMREGARYRFEQRIRREVASAQYVKESRSIAVLNDGYFANLVDGLPDLIELNTHSGIHAMTPYVKERATNGWEDDPRDYGFNSAFNESLVDYFQAMRANGARFTLETLEDGDGRIHKIGYSYPENEGVRGDKGHYLLDPDKDYLITEYRQWNSSGQLRFQMDVEPQRLDNGAWFPKKCFRKTPEYTAHLNIHEASVNQDIDDRLFGLESFDVDKSAIRLKQIEADGRTVTWMVLREGQWVRQ